MIPAFTGTPSGSVRVLVATRPVDFRKGMGGLAALVKDELLKDPYSGVVYVFRAKRADRVKMIWWDGTGLWLLAKTLEQGAFSWPKVQDGVMRLRVLVVRRPKYACRACEEAVVQAPAPARLIEGGLPTEATVAQVLVAKYADHLPLYRQAQIYARQGIELDRSTLADWVGRAAFLLRPIHERLLMALKASPKLFADETTAPVLDPGRGRTKLGQLWAYARR